MQLVASTVQYSHNKRKYREIFINATNQNFTPTFILLYVRCWTRLSYLKDDQNYLVHPKTFVNNCLRTIATHESNEKIRGEIKNLLE